MNHKILSFVPIFCILIAAFVTRFYGINWDQGYHLHPDERAIILFTIDLRFPQSFSEFLSTESLWNPKFFAYGSLPLYLLYSISSFLGNFFPLLASYDGIQFVGRTISALADIGIILLLFTLGKKYFSQKIALLAASFYLLSTFALQAAHFYAVDTLLTFFILLSLYSLLEYNRTQHLRKLIAFSVFFAFALATKVNAILLLFPFTITLCYHAATFWTEKNTFLKNLFQTGKYFLHRGVVFFVVALIIFFLCEPYAFLDHQEFLKQIQQQSEMTKSAWTFPYTLQYVGKIPYLYELTQIFLWGQGPFLALISFVGILYTTVFLFSHTQKKQLSILLSFFWLYIGIVGGFAVGFMRYMLPIYPILCLCGAVFFIFLIKRLPHKLHTTSIIVYLLLISILPVSFLSIYTRQNTKVQATEYILSTIPPGATLAVEHWDDQLPLKEAGLYQTETLELYLPDSPGKWERINQQLTRSDYIILASNRLYTPLAKLIDCEKLYPRPCYKETAAYYQELFSGQKGFEKIAEFTSFPTIPLLTMPLPDQSADESFTVYDHSKVQIFKKRTL